jgi:carboxyl-terminal processing protease
MRRRILHAAGAILFAALTILASAAVAQQAVTLAVSSRTLQVEDLLRQGRQLELQRRWGEAVTHYEDALRAFPDEQSLERRFESARLHYDLGRRYADRSFCRSLAELSPQQALDLYAGVLLKIQAHYVEEPNWRDLVARGGHDFEVALGEAAFRQQNVPVGDWPAIEPFRAEVRKTLAARTVETRQDACDAVAGLAALAQQRLGMRPVAAILECLCGAANSLDPYSSYLTPDQLGEVYSQIEGNFVGLGVELKTQGGELVVVRVISGSPAEAAGVRLADRIVAVDGRSVKDMPTDQAANLLQGREGTTVMLSVAAPAAPPRTLNICRRRVEVPSVDKVQMLDSRAGVGYLRLTCFQKTTRRDLEAALWQLHRNGMRSLVLDLRGNPGGLLITAVEVVELFIDHGVIVSTHGRSPQEDFTYTAHGQAVWQTPLVVLIDQDSASAAEIFAGAIRDHHRGTLVGVRSFGKGSVQGIFPLESSEAGLRLTTAKFYSPNGHPFSRTGVEPDIQVRQAARPIQGGAIAAAGRDDAMLQAALETARNRAQQR